MGTFWKNAYKLIHGDKNEKDQGRSLFLEYKKQGYLSLTNRELLELPLPVIIDYFYRFSLTYKGTSPISRKRDSRWMCESDFCFFNIRAASTGRNGGDFIRAAMLLSALRVDAIHLAPVMSVSGENLNSLVSHAHINKELTNRSLLNLGFSVEDQLKGFVQAAHLLNIKVGFDLPLTLSCDGEVLYRRPNLFRWIKLAPSKRFSSERGLPFSEEIQEEVQEEYARRIGEMVEQKHAQGLAYSEMGRYLREEGFFPIPVNSVRRKGIPLFINYDESINKPLFTNSSHESDLTTFQFCTLNGGGVKEKCDGVDYFARIFPLWQKKFTIDFLYIDSLAPAYMAGEDLKETPSATQIKKILTEGRNQKASAGVMTTGEREKLVDYKEAGFNLILDREPAVRQDRDFMETQLNLYKKLLELNDQKRQTISVLFSLGAPELGSNSSLQRTQRNHFLSRFLGASMGRRGKYEVMGYNDGSSGFINTLTNRKNLFWNETRQNCQLYHRIENIYEKEIKNLNKGKIVHTFLNNRVFWWIIKSGNKLIIPLISVENDDMLPPGDVEIDLAPFLSDKRSPSVMEYDFSSSSGNLILFMGGKLPVDRVLYRNFRLYLVE